MAFVSGLLEYEFGEDVLSPRRNYFPFLISASMFGIIGFFFVYNLVSSFLYMML